MRRFSYIIRLVYITVKTIFVAALATLTIIVIFQERIVFSKGTKAAHNINIKTNAILDKANISVEEIGQLIYDSRATVAEVNKASLDERKYFEKDLPVTMNYLNNILISVNKDADDLHPLLQTTTKQISSLEQIEENINTTVTSTNNTIADLDTQIKNPLIQESLSNINQDTANSVIITKNTADLTGHLDATAKDVQDEVHHIVHPPLITNIVSWTLKVGQAMGTWASAIF